MTREVEEQIKVLSSDLIEAAIEVWRLEKYFGGIPEPPAAIRHFLRRMKSFLSKYEITTLDLTGEIYHDGLAVEIMETLENKGDPAFEKEIIEEMILPIALQGGKVIRHGQVVLRRE
jgi:hypothetical protein